MRRREAMPIVDVKRSRRERPEWQCIIVRMITILIVVSIVSSIVDVIGK